MFNKNNVNIFKLLTLNNLYYLHIHISKDIIYENKINKYLSNNNTLDTLIIVSSNNYYINFEENILLLLKNNQNLSKLHINNYHMSYLIDKEDLYTNKYFKNKSYLKAGPPLLLRYNDCKRIKNEVLSLLQTNKTLIDINIYDIDLDNDFIKDEDLIKVQDED